MWAVNNALCIQTGSEAKPNQRETNNTLTGCMTIRLRSDFPETLSFGLRQSTESFGLTKPLAQGQLCQSNWKRRVWWNSDCIWLCMCLPFLLSCRWWAVKARPQQGYHNMEGASLYLKLFTAAQAPEKLSTHCFQVPFSVKVPFSVTLDSSI